MQKINAVIMAGDGKKNEVSETVENKAFLPILGKPMVEYVVDALRSSEYVGQISIIGPLEPLKEHFKDRIDYYYQDKKDLFDNLRLVLEPFKNDDAVLLVSSDIPMITGEMLDDLIAECKKRGGDLCYPIVERKYNEELFPDIKRTYVKLREGSYTGGNVFYFNPEIIETCAAFAQKFLEYRKKPWKSAKLLGLDFLLAFFMGRLTIDRLERRFSDLIGIEGHAVVTPFAEVGNDVDKSSDVDIVIKYFEAKNNSLKSRM